MAYVIKIQYLDNTVKRITKIEKGDWIDLYAAKDYIIQKGKNQLIHLGVAMKLPDGYEAIIAPRSSTYKNFGLLQTNHIGVIDNSYCGPNDWWYFSALAYDRDCVIHKGDKICQFRIQQKQPVVVFEETQLTGEDRGGFGSTGKT